MHIFTIRLSACQFNIFCVRLAVQSGHAEIFFFFFFVVDFAKCEAALSVEFRSKFRSISPVRFLLFCTVLFCL